MTRKLSILFALVLSTVALRADLILEQQFVDTNQTRVVTLKIHGDQMRMDEQGGSFSVVVDLKTRDSFTLLTNKTFLQRLGSEVRWQMDEERKFTGGTNDMDAPAAPPVDTGRSETVNGQATEIYTWSGAHGRTETLWVAKNFPNFEAIRPELHKLDRFDDTGPHRNAQPPVSRLPGMVVRSESVSKGRKTTTTLVSVKLEPVNPSLFEIPDDYKAYEPPEKTKKP